MAQRKGFEFNSQNTLVSLLFLVLGFIALVWIVRGIFTILAWMAPILLIATLIINYRIVLNYGKWILRLLKNNLLMGVLVTLLTIVGFPVVTFLLFGRAILQRQARKLEKAMNEQQEGQYTEYEIIEEEHDQIELPPLKEEIRREDNDYDRFFD